MLGISGPGLKTPSDMYFDPAAFIFSPIIGAGAVSTATRAR
jgi:hypothetical protein